MQIVDKLLFVKNVKIICSIPT